LVGLGDNISPGVFSAQARQQYGAVAAMRWQMLRHSLRTRRGNFELGARIFSTVFFGLIGLAAGVGLGFGAFAMATEGGLSYLPLLFWPVFFLWQFTPLIAASFQDHVDMSSFLRFPLSFGAYVSMSLVFGLFDIAMLIGSICLYGIWTGLVIARPRAVLGITFTLLLFAAFNILLTRMIFAWIDRWLAQRRTREILGVAFLFLMLSLQLINPIMQHFQGGRSAINPKTVLIADQIQSYLPPGMAAMSVRQAMTGNAAGSIAPLGGLILYGAGAGLLLSLRLRAEYRGESLGEGASRQGPGHRVKRRTAANAGGFPGIAGPVGAVIEKELRYLSRSGVMMYSLVAPLIMLILFGGQHAGGGISITGRFALPIGAAYTFLGLTRLIYNSLGGDGAGVQFYFTSPTPFRTIMLAKNLVQAGLFCAELALVCVIVHFRFGMPGRALVAATFGWLLFALPLQLAAGNVLSIRMAYRMTLTRMSREEGASGNALSSLGIQLVIVGVGAAIFLPLSHYGYSGVSVMVFLGLAVVSAWVWFRIFLKIDTTAAARREALIQALARA
jgi:ABC-2 type transport system permease protein